MLPPQNPYFTQVLMNKPASSTSDGQQGIRRDHPRYREAVEAYRIALRLLMGERP